MRRKARLDDNHGEVVKALRKLGCSVQSLASIGSGCPDILVACGGKMFVAEIKDGSKPPSARKLTADEYAWHKLWKAPVFILESVDDAVLMINTPP